MDDYQSFIHKSRYARWLPDESRREDWRETVERYMEYICKNAKDRTGFTIDDILRNEITLNIINLEIMPSMRAMMTAGPALDRCNVAGYNCSYLPIDDLRSFDELLYILMCGTGVGYSVENKYVEKLPKIPSEFTEDPFGPVVVEDSKEGWAVALRQVVTSLYLGWTPTWDLSKLRPAGARLKTFGGRSSGPAPLDDLLNFVVEVVKGNAGKKLSSINCHDICCKIGDCVVVGGVRRSAMISLSDLEDNRMRNAKSGNWWIDHPYRALANNSAIYDTKPSIGEFMEEWVSLYKSGSGERGIFNREASNLKASQNGRRDTNVDFGTNPCSEIILRPYQFCNLTEVVVKSDDTIEDLRNKVGMATVLGTLQSLLTDFRYLRPEWKKNTEEERLLGVSLTGIFDNNLMAGCAEKGKLEEVLENLRQEAIDVNEVWARVLGIKQSTAITCVKPSGTVSQLVNAASGIHPRHSEFYIRNVRADAKDPLAQFMAEQGVPWEYDSYSSNNSVLVFSFPIRAPEGSLLRKDMSAVEHLELWKTYAEHWCEHKPSITVSVREEEWLAVACWVYDNFDICSGVSFLPYSSHTYTQAPYQECTEEEYNTLKTKHKGIDWTKFVGYEVDDNTAGIQTLACSADSCEVVDLTSTEK